MQNFHPSTRMDPSAARFLDEGHAREPLGEDERRAAMSDGERDMRDWQLFMGTLRALAAQGLPAAPAYFGQSAKDCRAALVELLHDKALMGIVIDYWTHIGPYWRVLLQARSVVHVFEAIAQSAWSDVPPDELSDRLRGLCLVMRWLLPEWLDLDLAAQGDLTGLTDMSARPSMCELNGIAFSPHPLEQRGELECARLVDAESRRQRLGESLHCAAELCTRTADGITARMIVLERRSALVRALLSALGGGQPNADALAAQMDELTLSHELLMFGMRLRGEANAVLAAGLLCVTLRQSGIKSERFGAALLSDAEFEAGRAHTADRAFAVLAAAPGAAPTLFAALLAPSAAAKTQREASVASQRPAVPCAACGVTAPCQRCAACRAVAYCSRACQKQHWPEHRTVCRPHGKA